MAQTIEGFVNNALDEAKISPLHQRVIALIAAGYFCDVIDYTIYGSLVPFIIKSGFAATDAAFIGSATIIGLAIGTAGQGEFSDRFGRRFVYQFNLLFFGLLTILGTLRVLGIAAMFASGGDAVSAGYVWRGVWILIGILALIVWVFRFTLPESPRYLATHGRGKEALDILGRIGVAQPTQPLSTDAASNTKSDPFGIVF